MRENIILRKLNLCLAATALVLLGAAVSASAQPVRIAVGAASVASLPTWVAQDGGYFAREKRAAIDLSEGDFTANHVGAGQR